MRGQGGLKPWAARQCTECAHHSVTKAKASYRGLASEHGQGGPGRLCTPSAAAERGEAARCVCAQAHGWRGASGDEAALFASLRGGESPAGDGGAEAAPEADDEPEVCGSSSRGISPAGDAVQATVHTQQQGKRGSLRSTAVLQAPRSTSPLSSPGADADRDGLMRRKTDGGCRRTDAGSRSMHGACDCEAHRCQQCAAAHDWAACHVTACPPGRRDGHFHKTEGTPGHRQEDG